MLGPRSRNNRWERDLLLTELSGSHQRLSGDTDGMSCHPGKGGLFDDDVVALGLSTFIHAL